MGLSRIIRKEDGAPSTEAPDKLTEDFINSLGRVYTSEWQFHSEKAIKSALSAFKSAPRSEAGAKKVNASINKIMGQYGKSDEFQTDTEDMVTAYYGDNVALFIKDHSLYVEKASMSGPTAAVNFTQRDVKAVEVISNLTNQSAGKYFPDQVSGKTSEVVSDVVLDQGLTTKEAAVKLEEELRGALGVKDAASTVPTQYATNPQAYFEILTQNAAIQANSVGRMISMYEADVERYRVVAIIDKRTSQICIKLDGQEFDVSKGIKSIDMFLEVDNLNDLQNLMPFSKNDSVPKWAEEGLGFPPYHHKCRTTVIPVGI